MSAAMVESELCIHVEQIVSHGFRADHLLTSATKCDYCAKDARWLLGTGADPDLLPHCDEHARSMLSCVAALMEKFAESPA
jgi:hypothetical protein